MSRKTSPARKAAFLKALAETGNQTIAAERAKVSRSWVQLHRSTDPEFKADVAGAVAAAKERLRDADGTQPPRGWGHLDGEELVVRGTNGRRVQIARARPRQWTPRLERRFLDVLGATCNAKAAFAAVGLTPASGYEHRKRRPGFAKAWDEMARTCARQIDRAMVAGAIRLLDPPEAPIEPPEPAIEPMSVDDAIRLMRIYERRERDKRREAREGWRDSQRNFGKGSG